LVAGAGESLLHNRPSLGVHPTLLINLSETLHPTCELRFVDRGLIEDLVRLFPLGSGAVEPTLVAGSPVRLYCRVEGFLLMSYGDLCERNRATRETPDEAKHVSIDSFRLIWVPAPADLSRKQSFFGGFDDVHFSRVDFGRNRSPHAVQEGKVPC